MRTARWRARAVGVLSRLRSRYRTFRYSHGGRYRNHCLKCGFLAFNDGGEAPVWARDYLAAEGKAGWFSEQAPVGCHKNMWVYEDDPFNVLIFEANRARPSCDGFHPWVPGRSPVDHLKLEDERRTFKHQRGLAWLAFLGGLIGALIGAAVGVLAKWL